MAYLNRSVKDFLIKSHPPDETQRIADQHENHAAANNWFSWGFETANPKAEKALLTNLADVGS